MSGESEFTDRQLNELCDSADGRIARLAREVRRLRARPVPYRLTPKGEAAAEGRGSEVA